MVVTHAAVARAAVARAAVARAVVARAARAAVAYAVEARYLKNDSAARLGIASDCAACDRRRQVALVVIYAAVVERHPSLLEVREGHRVVSSIVGSRLVDFHVVRVVGVVVGRYVAVRRGFAGRAGEVALGAVALEAL